MIYLSMARGSGKTNLAHALAYKKWLSDHKEYERELFDRVARLKEKLLYSLVGTNEPKGKCLAVSHTYDDWVDIWVDKVYKGSYQIRFDWNELAFIPEIKFEDNPIYPIDHKPFVCSERSGMDCDYCDREWMG